MSDSGNGRAAARGIINFHKIAHALAAERALNEAGIAVELIVPPPALDQGCNLGLVFDMSGVTEIEKVLREKGIPFGPAVALE